MHSPWAVQHPSMTPTSDLVRLICEGNGGQGVEEGDRALWREVKIAMRAEGVGRASADCGVETGELLREAV